AGARAARGHRRAAAGRGAAARARARGDAPDAVPRRVGRGDRLSALEPAGPGHLPPGQPARVAGRAPARALRGRHPVLRRRADERDAPAVRLRPAAAGGVTAQPGAGSGDAGATGAAATSGLAAAVRLPASPLFTSEMRNRTGAISSLRATTPNTSAAAGSPNCGNVLVNRSARASARPAWGMSPEPPKRRTTSGAPDLRAAIRLPIWKPTARVTTNRAAAGPTVARTSRWMVAPATPK